MLWKIDFNDSKKHSSIMDPSIKALMNGRRRSSSLVPIWARETKSSERKRVTEENKEQEPLFKLKSLTLKRGPFEHQSCTLMLSPTPAVGFQL